MSSAIEEKLKEEYKEGNIYQIDKCTKIEVHGQYPRDSKFFEILLLSNVIGLYLFLGWLAYLSLTVIIGNPKDSEQIIGGCSIFIIAVLPLALTTIFYPKRIKSIRNRINYIKNNLENANGTYGYIITSTGTPVLEKVRGVQGQSIYKVNRVIEFMFMNGKQEIIMGSCYYIDNPFSKINHFKIGNRIPIAFNDNTSFILKKYKFL